MKFPSRGGTYIERNGQLVTEAQARAQDEAEAASRNKPKAAKPPAKTPTNKRKTRK